MGTALLVSNIVLWLLLVLLALAVLALSRQIGLLHERIAPAGALMVEHGPKVGETAPVVTAAALAGEAVRIGGEHGSDKSTLAFFLSPNCPVCKTLLPVLKSARKSERGWLDIVLASDGDVAQQREFVREAGLGDFPYVVSAELGMTYRVGKLPYAVLIDEAGVLRAKGLVNTREHLESLFEAKERGVASIQEYFAEAAPRA